MERRENVQQTCLQIILAALEKFGSLFGIKLALVQLKMYYVYIIVTTRKE